MDGSILVVDDDPDIAQSLKLLLEHEPGTKVLMAANAEAGLRILDAEKVALVLSDLRMPGMDGIEFLVECRRRQPETPRLLMTAYPDPAVSNAALDRDAAGMVISKPLDLEFLVSLVRALVQRDEGQGF